MHRVDRIDSVAMQLQGESCGRIANMAVNYMGCDVQDSLEALALCNFASLLLHCEVKKGLVPLGEVPFCHVCKKRLHELKI